MSEWRGWRTEWRDLDWFSRGLLYFLGAMLLLQLYGAAAKVRLENENCHRFYSAAATARDSLWVQTLRPECQVTS